VKVVSGTKLKKLKMTILYVEDEDVVRTTISEMLSRRVERVLVASNGKGGLEQYYSGSPQMLISDIKMPIMDGLEMIKRIKLEEAEIPVIITSAHSESEYFLQAIDIGVDKFVLKPVKNRELFNIINKTYEQMTIQQRIKDEELRREVAQRNLRESQEQLHALFENVVVGMGILDNDLQIMFANLTLSEMFMETEDSLLRHNIAEYLSGESLTIRHLKKLTNMKAVEQVKNFRAEELIQLPGGTNFWAEISISVILSPDNIITKFIIVVNNVNNRVEFQRERDTLYKSLISELEMAASVQSYFLPDWLCVEDDLLFSNNYSPSTNVGGDLFDIIRLADGRYIIYIGDISGHGVQSALMMTAVKATIKMLVDSSQSILHPSKIISQLNVLLSRDVFQNNYLTLLLGVLDVVKKEFCYFNAGHPPLLKFCKATGEVELIESQGSIPIGWMIDHEYSSEEEDIIILDDYCSYLLYTDGIFEYENGNGQELGINGIMGLLHKCEKTTSTVLLPYAIKKLINDNGYDITTDDFSILSFSIRRDLNENIRYYKVNPRKDNSGDAGKRTDEFLRAKGMGQIAFSAELLINEFLNIVLGNITEKGKESIIVIRLRVYERKLEIVFWDKGEEWQLPSGASEVGFEGKKNEATGSFYIICNLADEIYRQRVSEVNETKFCIYLPEGDNRQIVAGGDDD
jgi:phosphoserine phosphatase RsbU/P